MLVKQKEDERKAIEEASKPEGVQDLLSLPTPGQGAVGSTDADKLAHGKPGVRRAQPANLDKPIMPGTHPEKFGIDPNKLAFMGPPRAAKTSKKT